MACAQLQMERNRTRQVTRPERSSVATPTVFFSTRGGAEASDKRKRASSALPSSLKYVYGMSAAERLPATRVRHTRGSTSTSNTRGQRGRMQRVRRVGFYTKLCFSPPCNIFSTSSYPAYAAMAITQSHPPHRSIQLDKAAKALPEASRRAEDQLRQAFFAEVGAVLSSLGAAPALRAPKKLNGDAGVCLR